MKLFNTLLIILLSGGNLQAQEDFTWWGNIHNWDGYSPWVQYMTMSTSFMGPNALPVPGVSNGSVDSLAEIELSASYHFSDGDKTTDFYTGGYLPLYDDRVAASLYVVPYEWFETDTIIRDQRAARTRSGKGGAGGDIYFSTEFQLVRNHESFPDLLLRTAFRTASGTNLRNARHTDGAGYFFDISAGKNYTLFNYPLRLYVMGGFYAYQTYDLHHPQNDCILFGGGADFRLKRILISQSVGGYSGYLKIGDKPVVYRASLRLLNKHFDWKISYQHGLNDFDFQRIRLGVIYHLNL